MAEFEAECQAEGIALWVLPPHSPKLNGHVERMNRTFREEWWECYEGETDVPTMQGAGREGEEVYNAIRPHLALGMRTPVEFLAEQFGIRMRSGPTEPIHVLVIRTGMSYPVPNARRRVVNQSGRIVLLCTSPRPAAVRTSPVGLFLVPAFPVVAVHAGGTPPQLRRTSRRRASAVTASHAGPCLGQEIGL